MKKTKKRAKQSFQWPGKWALALSLFALAWVFYGGTLGNAYNLDDSLVTEGHPLTSRGLSAVPDILTSYYYVDGAGNAFDYRPVTLLSFALEHELFGESAMVSHLVNVLLYAATVVLLFFFLSSILPASQTGLVLLIGILFLIHPLHSEVVAGIKSRDELLALLFSLGAGLLFVRPGSGRQAIGWLLGGVGLYGLAILAKLSALPFAFLLPLSLYFFTKTSRGTVLMTSVVLAGLSLLFFPPLSSQNYLMFGLFALAGPLFLNEWKNAALNTPPKMGQWIGHADGRRLLSLTVLLPLSILFFSVSLYIEGQWWPQLAFLIIGALLALWWRSASFNWLLFGGLAVLLELLAWKTGNLGLAFTALFLPLTSLLTMDGPWSWKKYLSLLLPLLCLFPVFEQFSMLRSLVPWLLVALAFMLLRNYPKLWIRAMFSVLLLASAVVAARDQHFALAAIEAAGVLCLWWPLRSGNERKKVLVIYLLTVLLAAAWMVLSYQLPSSTPAPEVMAETEAAGSRYLTYVENPIHHMEEGSRRVASSMSVIVEYARLLIWPVRLQSYYGYDTIPLVDWTHWRAWLGLLLLLALAAAILWSARERPLLTFGLVLLLLGLLQFSNLLVAAPGMVGERLLYVGSLGLAIVLALGLREVWQGLALEKDHRWWKYGLVLLLTGLCWWRVQLRNSDWKDALSLFRHDVAVSPSSAQLQHLLARELLARTQTGPAAANADLLSEAEVHLRASLAIDETIPYGWYDLGVIYTKQGQLDKAKESFRKAAEQDVNPSQALFQLGAIEEQSGYPDAAETSYRTSIAADADHLAPYLNLSALYLSQGRLEEGIALCQAGLERWPKHPAFLGNMGNALATKGEFRQAATYFVQALESTPGDQQLLQKIVYCYQQAGAPELAQPFLQQLR